MQLTTILPKSQSFTDFLGPRVLLDVISTNKLDHVSYKSPFFLVLIYSSFTLIIRPFALMFRQHQPALLNSSK